MSLNALAKEVHEISVSKGFYENPNRNTGELIALIHAELSEALEELRSGMSPTDIYYPDFHTTDNAIENCKPEGFPIEIADTVIRILDMCAFLNVDIDQAIALKIAYNKTRPHKHGRKF